MGGGAGAGDDGGESSYAGCSDGDINVFGTGVENMLVVNDEDDGLDELRFASSGGRGMPAVTSEEIMASDRAIRLSFSCWIAALRPRRVKGKLASPIS